MNNEAEAMQQFVVWLLQTLDSASGTPSGDWSQAMVPEQTGSVNLQFSAEPLGSAVEAGILNDDIDPDGSSSGETAADRSHQETANPQDLSLALDEEPSQLAFGDIPAVQNRFHALLKHRLKTEIERNPPRFPWETEQHDYQYDYPYDYESTAESEPPFNPSSVGKPVPVWSAHLRTLNLPITLPDSVLHTLFDQCRQLMQSSLLEGRRLVQAVESLFPGEGATLESLAGLVLTSPVRSGAASLLRPTVLRSGLPKDYSHASPPQQMVLSLLAARQMFEAMTLTLSSSSAVHRSWLTEAGLLTLEAQYFPEFNRAQVKVQLPTGGTVQFQQNFPSPTTPAQGVSERTGLESIASCTRSGNVSVSLSPIAAEQPAMLSLELAGSEVPLVFSVRLPLER